MIQSSSSHIASALKHTLHQITVTKSAWKKCRRILNSHRADAIQFSATKVKSCSCIERSEIKHVFLKQLIAPPVDYIYNPTFSLVTSDDWKEINSLDKRYPPIILYDKETRIVMSQKTADIMQGVNIHYLQADYFVGIFNKGFVFSSSNDLHALCDCGNLVIRKKMQGAVI